MFDVLDGRVWIGALQHVHGPGAASDLSRVGITHAVNLSGMTAPLGELPLRAVLQVRVRDRVQSTGALSAFGTAASWVVDVLGEDHQPDQETRKVLVYCMAGVSRSSATVACVLMALVSEYERDPLSLRWLSEKGLDTVQRLARTRRIHDHQDKLDLHLRALDVVRAARAEARPNPSFMMQLSHVGPCIAEFSLRSAGRAERWSFFLAAHRANLTRAIGTLNLLWESLLLLRQGKASDPPTPAQDSKRDGSEADRIAAYLEPDPGDATADAVARVFINANLGTISRDKCPGNRENGKVPDGDLQRDTDGDGSSNGATNNMMGRETAGRLAILARRMLARKRKGTEKSDADDVGETAGPPGEPLRCAGESRVGKCAECGRRLVLERSLLTPAGSADRSAISVFPPVWTAKQLMAPRGKLRCPAEGCGADVGAYAWGSSGFFHLHNAALVWVDEINTN